MIKISIAGLASFAFASAQSVTHTSSNVVFSTAVPQEATRLAQTGQDVEGIQHLEGQSSPPNDTVTSTILVATVTVNAVVSVPEASTSASFTYVPPSTSSWPTFSFEPATTQDATFAYVPTTTDDIPFKPATIQDALFTYVPVVTQESSPMTTTKEPSFVFEPSAAGFVYVPAPTTAAFIPAEISSSNTTAQAAVTTVPPEVGYYPSAVTSDASYSLETVQTMVQAPTLDTPTWTSTTSWAAVPTPIVNAPPAEHPANNSQPPSPAHSTPAQSSVTLPTGLDAASQPEQQQPPGLAHVGNQNVPAPAPPAHHEPTQVLPTTQRTSSSTIHSKTVSSGSTDKSSTSETSKAVLQTAQDPAPVPAVHALTYQGQTVQLSGMTLAAGPTGSKSDSDDSRTLSGGTVDSAAVVGCRKSGFLLLMALAMTTAAW